MTIATTPSRVSYSGNGLTTAFSFPYEYRASGDLKVVIVSSANVATLKTITTHYTISGVSDSHGGYSSATVTMVTAPASGETLVIFRSPSVVQEADIESESDPLYAVNNALDLATYVMQHLENDKLGLPLGVTEAFSNKLPDLPDDDGVTYYLGPSSDRASLSWLTGLSSSTTIASAWSTVVNTGSIEAGLAYFAGISQTSTVAGTAGVVAKNSADSNNVVALRLIADRNTPANTDILRVEWALNNASGTEVEYGREAMIASDVTAGAEVGQFRWFTRSGGSLSARLYLQALILAPTSNDGLALGTTTEAFSDLFLASGAVVNFNNGDVTLTHSANALAFAGASSGYTFDNFIKSTSATAGVGYATGAGGTVTQASNKSTGVTLDKICGQITMNNATLNAAAEVGFTLTNSTIGATDVVVVCIATTATADSYQISVDAVAAGSCHITLTNVSAGNLGEALVLNFAVIKAVAA